MEKTYWLGRRSSAVAMARIATSSKARLIHYDLAGRYSIKAANCVPFMLPTSGPATEGEASSLRIAPPSANPPLGGKIPRKRLPKPRQGERS